MKDMGTWPPLLNSPWDPPFWINHSSIYFITIRICRGQNYAMNFFFTNFGAEKLWNSHILTNLLSWCLTTSHVCHWKNSQKPYYDGLLINKGSLFEQKCQFVRNLKVRLLLLVGSLHVYCEIVISIWRILLKVIKTIFLWPLYKHQRKTF